MFGVMPTSEADQTRLSFPSAATMKQATRRRARRAWGKFVLLALIMGGLLTLDSYRRELLGADQPVRIAVGIALMIVGWAMARDLGNALGPALARRGIRVAGPLAFVIRLVTIGATIVVALRLVGLKPSTLAEGGAVTAIILGLAAQQTLGNLFAGIVLLSARPFRVGDRVRLQGGGLGGTLEGVALDSGLLYATLGRGDDRIYVPNSVVLNCAVVPLREPGGIDVRVKMQPEVKPTDLQTVLEDAIDTPVRGAPHIHLEEVDSDEVVLRVSATPAEDADGPRLADEMLAALREVAGESAVRAD